MYRYLIILVLSVALGGLSWAYVSLSHNCSDYVKELKSECDIIDIRND